MIVTGTVLNFDTYGMAVEYYDFILFVDSDDFTGPAKAFVAFGLNGQEADSCRGPEFITPLQRTAYMMLSPRFRLEQLNSLTALEKANNNLS